MTTIYLHIGMPKTGTTSIQRFLLDNVGTLERHGIGFPDFGFRYSRVGQPRNGHFLARVRMSDSGALAEDAEYANYQSALEQLTEQSRRFDRIILSDEDLWVIINEQPSLLKKLRQDLEERGMALRVLVYLRRQDNFVQSIYRQKVKRFKTDLPFDRFLDEFDPAYPLDYYACMTMLSDCVGKENLLIRVYEKNQYRGKEHDLFSDFLDVFGLAMEDGFEIKNPAWNPSLPDTRLELRRALSPLSKPYKDKVLMDALLSFPEDGSEPASSGRSSFFGPGEQSAYLETFSESNARLAREYLGREDGALFYDESDLDLPEYAVDTEALLRETIFLYGRSVQLLEDEIKDLRRELRKEIRDVREDVLFYRLKRKLRHIFRKEQ